MRSVVQLVFLLWFGRVGYVQNWVQLDTVTAEALHSVSFIDTLYGWAAGATGTILFYHAPPPHSPTAFHLALPVDSTTISEWKCENCSSGQYLAVMSADGFTFTRKVMLLK